MSDEVRVRRLRLALRVIGTLFVVTLGGYMILILLESPLAAESSLFASLFRWSPYNVAYEGMLASVHIIWGIFLWKASVNPDQHKLFIEFTIWANLAHALVMLVGALLLEGELIQAVSDVVLLGGVGGVLIWLRPRSTQAASYESGA